MQNGDDNSGSPSGYLLGEMAATVRSIDKNVTAIRTELGDLGHRLGVVEIEIATMQAERRTLIPQYHQFVDDTKKFVEDTSDWRSKIDGGAVVAKSGGKLFHNILGGIFAVLLFIAGQIWMDQRADRTSHPQQQPRAATPTR